MKNPLKALLFSLCVLGSMNCWGQAANSQSRKDFVANGKVYTAGELSNLITVGMSETEVTNQFGAPISVRDEGQFGLRLEYMFTTISYAIGSHLDGFDVVIKDGKAASWDPIFAVVRPPAPQLTYRESGRATFEMYVVDPAISNLLATEIPLQSAIVRPILHGTPHVKFVADAWLALPNKEQSGLQTILFELEEADAAKLKEMTSTNINQQIFVVSSNTVLAVREITGPIYSRRLNFTTRATNFFQVTTN